MKAQYYTPRSHSNSSSLRSRCAAAILAVSALLISPQSVVHAQSDNFDAYSTTADLTSAGWILSSLNPALVQTTLPAVGSGKGLRIVSNPIPNAAPAAGMWYRTNEYTDFCVMVDIASWPGTDKNQAMVIFSRLTDATTGTVINNQNPANAQGLICNYDAAQYGENPDNRRQGQFQINVITTVPAPFTARTIAVSEITFEPGRAYRLVFKGVGTHFTAEAYDWNDLSKPLVRLEAEDSTFPSGACGLLSFSRQSTVGTTDVTFDNYYAGATDPNPATAPALAHPLPGTPIVDTRTPGNRWANFWNPASGISFTAKTYTADVIDSSATRLLLNGRDVSTQLVLSADGTSITGSLPGSALTPNTVYSAEIIVADTTGTKTSKNTFWFDTFSDAFLLTSAVKVIEAEEYNYSSGGYQLDPIAVSGVDTNGTIVNGSGVGYYEAIGNSGIDYSNRNQSPDLVFAVFRSQDPVRILRGGFLGIEDFINADEFAPASDTVRSPHAASNLLEYVVVRTEPTEWLNYTRSFTAGFYTAYLRYSSFGATTNELHLVTGDPTQFDQTTSKLGSFPIPNNIRWANYHYAPLVDDSGRPALLSLSGLQTLRLAIAGTLGPDNRKTMLNYIMLVQAPITLYSSATIDGTYAPEPTATVNTAARTVSVAASGGARYYRIGSNVALPIKGISVAGGTVTLSL